MVYTKDSVSVAVPLYIILEGHGLLIAWEAERADDWQMGDFEGKKWRQFEAMLVGSIILWWGKETLEGAGVTHGSDHVESS